MKVYLCAITQNEKENMDELTRDVHKNLDGLIIVDGGSTDGTKELMEERKGGGEIISRKWTDDHDLQMNEFLRQGPMKNGDWFLLRDSTERISEQFSKELRSLCQEFKNNGIRTVYDASKILLAQYHDDQLFSGNPHWGLSGQRQKIISLRDYPRYKNSDEYWWNERPKKRSPSEKFKHQLKYYYVYGRANHMLLGNEKNIDKFRELEAQRQRFRSLCMEKYNLDPTIKSLETFLRSNYWKNDVEFCSIINSQKILSDYYRFAILNEDADHINSTQPPRIP